MIATVAVGTDGSKTAGLAVDAAIDLAERFGAKLVVLSAFGGSSAASAGIRLPGAVAAPPEWSSNAAEAVDRILDAAEQRAAARGVECSTAVEQGDPADVLVRLAEKHGADVIVVGNIGMERRVLGSIPNTVSHRATCSVLVVKTS
jgi:nucleotide-binding universal stress UspA family protein